MNLVLICFRKYYLLICLVRTQLQRHGARFPTLGAAARMAIAITNIQQATAYLDPAFEFIRDWEYDLGFDDLIHYGAAQ